MPTGRSTVSWGLAAVVGSAAVLIGAGCTKQAVQSGAPGVVCTGYQVDPPPEGSAAAAGPMTMAAALARLDAADDWKTHPPLDLPRHPAEKYLEGWVIVLDPGHGGKSLEVDGWKMGPTGVREAEMNLRVGLMLRELLEDAGATVGLTRTEETSDIADDRIGDYDHNADADPDDPATWNTLKRRAHFANTFPRPQDAKLPAALFDDDGNPVGADLFISIHHNASSSPESNYTTVWFHGPAENATVELDAARHLAREIGRGLRTDVGKTSPVMNDRQMYESGFGVLRHARVPAVLTESSFYTNPQEEQRLADPGYLIREAYAIYLGLCELAYSGRPTQALIRADSHNGSGMGISGDEQEPTLELEFAISDGLPEWWGHDLSRTLSSTFKASMPYGVFSSIYEVGPDEAATHRVVYIPLHTLFIHPSLSSSQLDKLRTRDGLRALAAELAGKDTNDTLEFSRPLTIKHANFLKAHNWPQRYAVDLKWEPGADAPEVVAVRPLGAARPTPAE